MKINFKTKKYFSVKHFVLLFIVLLFASLSFHPASDTKLSEHKKVTRVVLDAGHGGHDPGAVGKKSKEKDITLEIALLTGSMIKKYCPDVEVYYTRETDVFVELYRRAKIANDLNADLFISIHCNASKRSEAKGTEVFVMGLDKSEQNLEIAKKENASILLEDNYEAKYDGIDPNSSEAYIVFNLFQHAFLEQSLLMATKTMEAFNAHVSLVNRGVKQAPFLVLWRTTMPSILIEMGFISNAVEEEFLLKADNKKRIAYAIYKAFVLYKSEVEGTQQKPVDFSVATGILNNNNNKTDVSNDEPQVAETQPSVMNTAEVEVINPDEIIFCVQLFVDTKLLPANHSRFKGIENINYYVDGKYYKYFTGNARKFSDAIPIQQQMRDLGFSDAFIIALYRGKRMDIKEARKMTD